MGIATVNPTTGETIQVFEPLTEAALERKLTLAQQTFEQYRRTSLAQRSQWLNAAADILDADKEMFGKILTLEMGKTLTSAIAEVEKCALVCRYYAEHAAEFLADVPAETEATSSFVRYQPLGAILAVMPWNFPFWQVFRFAAPALMAGNTGLLKHASNVPQCALAIEEIFLRAGFAEGVFQTLLIGVGEVADVIADDRVAAVTLTGSEPAGRSVASQAGQHIKKTVLELGGSDPFIIMPSANLEQAVATAVKARVINNGQSCIAAKRFIIADAIYDSCEREFVQQMRALKTGDPMDPSTELGPLANQKIFADLEDQVARAVSAGARLLTGGRRAGGTSLTYEPTVLADVPRWSPVYSEEFFGPVAMLFRVQDAGEAIEVANDSPFGLGASAWTQDRDEQRLFIDGLQSGQVFFNAMVASDPRVPFGGVKKSGYGRELGAFGIREFVNIKTIWIN